MEVGMEIGMEVGIPYDRFRARRKLQDDALAQTLIGKLCAQVPEVFQTHVMPHLTDKDLRSLAFLGSEPRRVMRGSSRATAVSSCYFPACIVLPSHRIRDSRGPDDFCPWCRTLKLDRFVGFDPDGPYCRRCRLKHGPSHGNASKTLPALHSHAKRTANSSGISEDREAHAKMFDAIDAVLGRAT